MPRAPPSPGWFRDVRGTVTRWNCARDARSARPDPVLPHRSMVHVLLTHAAPTSLTKGLRRRLGVDSRVGPMLRAGPSLRTVRALPRRVVPQDCKAPAWRSEGAAIRRSAGATSVHEG